MARPFTAQELIPELQSWIKRPTDPDLRKLLRRTVATLSAFVDLVGDPEPADTPSQPSLAERIQDPQ